MDQTAEASERLLAALERIRSLEEELRRAEQETERERERLALALRAGRLGVYEWRIAQDCLYWSPEVYDVFGVDPGSFRPSAESFLALVHPGDRQELWRKTQECIERHEVFMHEYRVVTPRGEVRWVANRSHVGLDPEGRPERVTGVAQDVTERVLEQQRLGILVSGIDDHIVSYDRQWRYTFVNAAAARVLGKQPEELLGRSIWELFPQAIGNQYYRELHAAAAERRAIRSEHDYAPFGRWYENHIYPHDDGVTVFATDVTARKRAEEALRASEERSKESDRRKDEFLALLAHELRNPLATIRNGVEILQRSEADARAAAGLLDRQVRHMVRLVDDLLDVSRISRGRIELRREPVELAAIVTQAIEINRPLLDGQRHELVVSLPDQPVSVEGDPVRLAQVVGNLLNNACKFSDPGGSIRLVLGRDGAEAVVRVRDGGIGIAPDQLGRIFEMFTQVDTSLERTRHGLGLGLTLVQTLVELHGGTVEAHSEGLGQGTEFVLRLPALAPAPAAHHSPAAATADAPRQRRVLVVDDNRDSADSLSMLLQILGHEVQTAYDGHEALGRAATFRPDAVLLDIGMPGLNGYEVARRLRERHGMALQIVALTGWGQDVDRRRSEEAGFDEHLVKPVDPDALAALLRHGQG